MAECRVLDAAIKHCNEVNDVIALVAKEVGNTVDNDLVFVFRTRADDYLARIGGSVAEFLSQRIRHLLDDVEE